MKGVQGAGNMIYQPSKDDWESWPVDSNGIPEVSVIGLLTALTNIATSAKQDTGNTTLASILTALGNIATSAKQDTGNSSLASIVAALAGVLSTNLSTALSAAIDSINVASMTPGAMVVALNGITATTTSAAIAVGAAGFKHVAIEFSGTGFTSGYSIALQGCNLIAGTYGDIYKQKDDGTYAKMANITFNTVGTIIYIIPNIGVNYLELVATKTDGTLTAKVTPFN